ncbi:MAG: rhomboid family intramembrane serine protease [Halobacteriota archaeon]
MARSPTLEVLAICTVVFLAQSIVGLVSVPIATGLFALSAPVAAQPWTLVTSIYAHASLGHFVANMIALVLFGWLLERRTTPWRFHAFFLLVGIVAGVSEVTVAGLYGQQVAVVGASGALFGLLGYLLAGNAVSAALFRSIQLRGRSQLVVFLLVAIGLTIATGRPGVALVAHFTGAIIGLLAGRLGVLDVEGRSREAGAYAQ